MLQPAPLLIAAERFCAHLSVRHILNKYGESGDTQPAWQTSVFRVWWPWRCCADQLESWLDCNVWPRGRNVPRALVLRCTAVDLLTF